MIKPRVKAPVVSLRILPSAMTVAAICLGLSSVKMALDNRPTEAMAFLAIAAILDALDGRIARILKATSRMGEEIDSLADAVGVGDGVGVAVGVGEGDGVGVGVARGVGAGVGVGNAPARIVPVTV